MVSEKLRYLRFPSLTCRNRNRDVENPSLGNIQINTIHIKKHQRRYCPGTFIPIHKRMILNDMK